MKLQAKHPVRLFAEDKHASRLRAFVSGVSTAALGSRLEATPPATTATALEVTRGLHAFNTREDLLIGLRSSRLGLLGSGFRSTANLSCCLLVLTCCRQRPDLVLVQQADLACASIQDHGTVEDDEFALVH